MSPKLGVDFQAGVPVRVKNFDDGTEIRSCQMYVERLVSFVSKLKTHIQVRVLEQDRCEHGVGVLISWKIVSSE